MDKKTLLKYTIAFILIFLIVTYLPEEYRAALSQLSLKAIVGSLLIQVLIYSITGVQFLYLLKKFYGITFSLFDIIFLPITMSLWSYIIPIKGGVLYSLAFFKCKYHFPVVASFSINLYIQLITLFITGFVGIYVAVVNKLFFSLLALFSIGCIFSPLLIYGLNKVFELIPDIQWQCLRKIRDITASLFRNIDTLWRDGTSTGVILLLNVIHIGVYSLWLYWAARSLNLALPFLSIVFLALVTEASVVFRITPGNLGIEQLLSGGVLYLLGGKMGDGISIALFTKITNLLLVGSIGMLANFYYMKFFHAANIRSLLAIIRRGERT